MDSRTTQQCNTALLAATSAAQPKKMQLTGWHNGNEMDNAICVDTQTSKK